MDQDLYGGPSLRVPSGVPGGGSGGDSGGMSHHEGNGDTAVRPRFVAFSGADDNHGNGTIMEEGEGEDQLGDLGASKKKKEKKERKFSLAMFKKDKNNEEEKRKSSLAVKETKNRSKSTIVSPLAQQQQRSKSTVISPHGMGGGASGGGAGGGELGGGGGSQEFALDFDLDRMRKKSQIVLTNTQLNAMNQNNENIQVLVYTRLGGLIPILDP